jgi:flagellar biosynthetic protein FlhB
VARSAELTSAAALLGSLIALGLLAPGLLDRLTKTTAALLDPDGHREALAPSRARATECLASAAGSVAPAAGALLAAGAAVAALTGFAQVGAAAAPGRIRPDFGRISPREGLRRLLSARSAVRGALAVAKVAAVGCVAYWTLRGALPRLAAAVGLDAWDLAAEAGRQTAALAMRVALCLLGLAAVDGLFQRWQHRRELRMTRREQADEWRQLEGDPRVRRRRRRAARDIGPEGAGSAPGPLSRHGTGSGEVRTGMTNG